MRNKKITATLTALTLSGQLLLVPLASATTVEQAVSNIKSTSDYSQLVNNITSTGKANQSDVDHFISDVVTKLDGKTITESNIKTELKSAAMSAALDSDNANVRNAMVQTFSSQDITNLKNGQLPSSIHPLGDIFKNELLGTQSSTTSSGGGGTTTTTGTTTSTTDTTDTTNNTSTSSATAQLDLTAATLNGNLANGNATVNLDLSGNKTYSIKLAAAEKALLNSQMKNIVMKYQDFTLNVPVSGIKSGSENLPTLTAKSGVAGKAYSAYTNLVVKGQEGVTVNLQGNSNCQLSFQIPTNLAPGSIKGLAIYRWNDSSKEWAKIGGALDSNGQTMTTTVTTEGTYALMDYQKTFADVPATHWAQSDIQQMASMGAVNGISDAQFAPNASVTRGEFAAMLQKALHLGYQSGTTTAFKDVATNAWYQGAVISAAQAGLMSGTGDGVFQPNRAITREEMTAILVRASGQTAENATTNYADAGQISSWAKDAVMQGSALGLVGGKENNHFAPRDHSTRAEAVVMLKRLLSLKGQF